jgi:hypothetical protein
MKGDMAEHNLRDVLQAQKELGEQESGLIRSMYEGAQHRFSLETKNVSNSPFTQDFLLFDEVHQKNIYFDRISEGEKDSSSFVIYDNDANRYISSDAVCRLLSGFFQAIRTVEDGQNIIGVRNLSKFRNIKTQSGNALDLGIGDIYHSMAYSIPMQKGFAKGISHQKVKEAIISDPKKYLISIGILNGNI